VILVPSGRKDFKQRKAIEAGHSPGSSDPRPEDNHPFLWNATAENLKTRRSETSLALSRGRILKNISAIPAGGIRAVDLFTAHAARLAGSYEIGPDDHEANGKEKQEV
jgi:hypothetical protein